jgi:colanic acid/amylovoran biosynthesis glycosyltransferase
MAHDTVCVWRDELLPPTETFIVNQAHAMRRWSPTLCGGVRRPGGLRFDPSFVIRESASPIDRADLALYRRAGVSARLLPHLRRARLIHAHFGPDAVRLLPSVRLVRRPFIVTFHGYDITTSPQALGVSYEALFARVTRLVAVSEFIRDELLQAGAPAGKIEICHIGIPIPPRPLRAQRARRLLFVGRLVEKKGCADLIEAVAGLTDPPPLLVVGDGPLRSELEDLAVRRRVDAEFVGVQSPAEVAAAMDRCVAFCVPSKASAQGDREGLGMVFLEAAAHEMPVISYASGGVPESIADGETGLLAPEGDVAALAAHLQTLLADTGMADRFGKAGRARVIREFDIANCTDALEDLYDAAADQ